MLTKKQTRLAIGIMGKMFPDAKPSLTAQTPFQYLIAVLLSAQATDISVNKVTPKLFSDFPDPQAMAAASEAALRQDIHSIGLYRNKAKHMKAASQVLVEKFNGVVPKTRQALVTLPGVGRKTAAVVLADAFGVPAFAVDTHVTRVTKRLQIVANDASVLQIEQRMTHLLPKKLWVPAHHRLIYFGRYHCLARGPKCLQCPLLSICADGQQRLALN